MANLYIFRVKVYGFDGEIDAVTSLLSGDGVTCPSVDHETLTGPEKPFIELTVKFTFSDIEFGGTETKVGAALIMKSGSVVATVTGKVLYTELASPTDSV